MSERMVVAPPVNAVQMPSTPTARTGAGAAAWLSLALSAIALIAAVVVGVGFIKGSEADRPTITAAPPALTTTASHQFYGGDAYTGIQNAAADTAHAVVDGVNDLGALQLRAAQQTAASAYASERRLMQGLGALLIALGVVNFTVALGRLGRR